MIFDIYLKLNTYELEKLKAVKIFSPKHSIILEDAKEYDESVLISSSTINLGIKKYCDVS